MPYGSSQDRWWRRSITDRQWDWITLGGLLLFGLPGFDVYFGAGFPKLKLVFLVLGVLAAAWRIPRRD